ncbi:tRNA dimethylallyltransferase 2 [Asparagus officinalis]|uniref:tRNA dimethylallyltransferase 2 n=1 Tax=Asparagus officinalis TaxID=4686 RepID=A0A5P1F065_ASPOF|nr:tRNA dimethylallyltransferase 2 [Asparagus officinalis]
MGATGSGKSHFSIDLASHFAGIKVINADSMQVYQGLDALVSSFLVDDAVQDMEEDTIVSEQELSNVDLAASYEHLTEIDPVAANKIHPNDHRKVSRS